ncbi:hypothetical protein QR680_013142 [Steinernema hermaphroditum]|uniref:RING-type domain-containing protein n=1 Tax=Steinernema hermaphroditum TaxID=289476 RepID=A0AA39I6J6_9BILA|nr:hypothetical protein QR680_013142 [Steinernema hermaphroditum]
MGDQVVIVDGNHHEAVLHNIEESQLSDAERWQIEHAKLHAKHAGHSSMHAEMFLILIVTLVVAQIALVQWKKRHFRSYQLVTLVGMWLVPFFICVHRGWTRFLLTWPHVSGGTPRFVYKWFLFLHKMSYVLGIVGYLLIVGALMGLHFLIGWKANELLDMGILFMFYGLYYGVLGRDFAHICTDRLACKIGYFTHEGLPKKVLETDVCAVCGEHLYNLEGEEDESIYKLTCNHVFHEFCIRGWCIVGKLQTCPYCKEKVDLKRMFKNPWEKPHLFYGQLLDWIRYLMNQKPFGLIVKSKAASASKPIVKISAFGASDDEEDEKKTLVSGGQRQSASTIRTQMKTERMHDEAIAEDPNLFDYDGYLERKEEVKAEREEEKKKENKGRKEAKYAGKLMQAHAKRELEKQLRDERKQIKEREQENGEFDDKEVFVTSAYKKQLELMEEFKSEQKQSDLFDEMTAVGKQKMWQQGFNRFMLENLSSTRDQPSTSMTDKEKETMEKMRRLREQSSADDGLQFDGVSVSQSSKKKFTAPAEKSKKSIYTSGSESEKEEDDKSKKPVARFDEELQPGLNKPRLAKTRQEQIQSRFTPTPEGSSESSDSDSDNNDRNRHSRRPRTPEGGRRRDRDSDRGRHRNRGNPNARESRRRRSRSQGRGESRHESEKKGDSARRSRSREEKPEKPKTKEERLEVIKKILKQRNSREQIAKMRERYFERRDQGIVPLPL